MTSALPFKATMSGVGALALAVAVALFALPRIAGAQEPGKPLAASPPAPIAG